MGAGGFMAEYPEYSNIMELADALLQGQIDAAIMKTSSIEMIDEMGDFIGFASDVGLYIVVNLQLKWQRQKRML